MKEWIRELCPEIDAWQVDMIAQHMQEAVAAEREACAKVCDKFNFGQAPKMIQDAIRARGQA